MVAVKILPAPEAVEAENAMLGGVFRDPRNLLDVLTHCRPEDCFIRRNTLILAAMIAIAERGEAADVVSVHEELRGRGEDAEIGGMVYLAGLMGATTDPKNTEDHARRVARLAWRRRLLKATDTIRLLAEKEPNDDALWVGMETALIEAERQTPDDEPASMLALMNDYFDHIEATKNLGAGVTGLATGYGDYDDLLDGIQPESLNMVAARPGMGKTSMLLCIALRVARRLLIERGEKSGAMPSGGVYIWSGEMGKKQLRERMASIESGLSNRLLRRGLRPGGLSQQEWKLFVQIAGSLHKLPIYIDDFGGATPAAIENRVKRLARRRGGLDLVIVDYIGLMEAGIKKQDRNNEMGFMSRRLKEHTAKVAPVLCAAQLNRSLERREDKRPTLSDLRDSGNLEQDADTVTFIYRDVEYNAATEFPNRADWIVAKNRHGATGAIYLHWEQTLTKFSDARVQHIEMSGL